VCSRHLYFQHNFVREPSLPWWRVPHTFRSCPAYFSTHARPAFRNETVALCLCPFFFRSRALLGLEYFSPLHPYPFCFGVVTWCFLVRSSVPTAPSPPSRKPMWLLTKHFSLEDLAPCAFSSLSGRFLFFCVGLPPFADSSSILLGRVSHAQTYSDTRSPTVRISSPGRPYTLPLLFSLCACTNTFCVSVTPVQRLLNSAAPR